MRTTSEDILMSHPHDHPHEIALGGDPEVVPDRYSTPDLAPHGDGRRFAARSSEKAATPPRS